MTNIKKLLSVLTTVIVVSACTQSSTTKSVSPQPIEVKAVVVTMFEIGEDSGDKPGEFQLWKTGQNLSTKFDFPQGHHDLFYNEKTGVLGMVTGMGIAKASAAIMALGLDERFDLTHSYWLVAGIAGIDPEDASIGSAAWTTWLVDGGLAHQIDAREMPKDWKTGYFPLFYTEPPSAEDHQQSKSGEAFKLNNKLTDWAYELTKDTKLNDYPKMKKLRDQYSQYPNAQKPPFVLKGEHLSSSTFWHGKLLNDWANDWTKYWTNGEGNFVSSGMEDTGAYQAMSFLHNAGKVNKNRFMVLRTASNYTTQPYGLTAAENLAQESGSEGYAGMQSALESAYAVGSKVIDTLVSDWSTYKNTMPYDKK
ncbi:purine nucleoside permease [Pseudocolwellia sp. AS88]|uniref:purine nucleoside permease n=1 Tax=Pseudocolwellia sp. AS88 TaxID=3063958 RepID=UPI0026EB444C|nr:purine nucleoside permease [Pseudocolwellia sp. AS88]MDO7086233.1 purine nucleoside permease [Pseudocolwellia sp. AS88]